MIILYAIQYSTGDYLYVHHDGFKFPRLLSQATMFETYDIATKFCDGNMKIRKLEIKIVDDYEMEN